MTTFNTLSEIRSTGSTTSTSRLDVAREALSLLAAGVVEQRWSLVRGLFTERHQLLGPGMALFARNPNEWENEGLDAFDDRSLQIVRA